MTAVFVTLAFIMGASAGAMLCAAVMLALAVSKEADRKAQTLFEGGEPA